MFSRRLIRQRTKKKMPERPWERRILSGVQGLKIYLIERIFSMLLTKNNVPEKYQLEVFSDFT